MERGSMLVVFYSRTGFTRLVAQDLARALNADLEELIDLTNRQGILGYLRSGFDAALHRLTQLQPLSTKPEAYDLVVVGTPIWNAAISSPVRTFLMDHKAGLKKVAFFCTYGGSGNERVFRQMEQVCGKAPLATMAVRDREMGSPMQDARVRKFVHGLETAAGSDDADVKPV
ncbi:MAG TPA: flavodoxin [Gemmatimonadales bacterium]|nr:flavodoxin [Gemmatimonadales bacterium]